MRRLLLALLLIPSAGFAQSQPPGTTTQGETPAARAPGIAPAPVPSIPPPDARGSVSHVPEQVAPPSVGANSAGPANATPFSGAPTNAAPGGGASSGASGGAPPILSR